MTSAGDLFFGESRENRFRKSEILRQHIRRSVTDPASDGKSYKFAEMVIVKAEDKVCFVGSKTWFRPIWSELTNL
jgi:hypothetical protein